jgi:hypothetical protein
MLSTLAVNKSNVLTESKDDNGPDYIVLISDAKCVIHIPLGP